MDIGEDRIVIEYNKQKETLADFYIPYNISPKDTAAEFNTNTKVG